MGLMFPMVESAEEAKELVSWTRYPPRGVRGAAFGIAHDDYAAGDVREKIAVAERRTLILALRNATPPLDREQVVDALEALGSFDVGIGRRLYLSAEDHQASHQVWPTVTRGGRIVPMEWEELAPTVAREQP